MTSTAGEEAQRSPDGTRKIVSNSPAELAAQCFRSIVEHS